LVFLAGGVTETTGSGISDNYPSGTNFVSNGQRNATAQVTLDGSPAGQCSRTGRGRQLERLLSAFR